MVGVSGLMNPCGETRSQGRTCCSLLPADQEADSQRDVQHAADLRRAGSRRGGRGLDPAE